jgi:hypothetical protein
VQPKPDSRSDGKNGEAGNGNVVQTVINSGGVADEAHERRANDGWLIAAEGKTLERLKPRRASTGTTTKHRSAVNELSTRAKP